ncbi:MAG: hypothetical protein E5V60_01175 [Mesorhizobium sp.]|uniref:hypothetical protein n=1 Tax=Mesorhizobium sp. M4A.F.Ca.ET.090.04.2.1 TaxID=2496663 RepID=UPI000FCC3B4B|nr:hypothetical protein [Mesorhizobium sp. M4A.F.Ca.ET.090.04.2.1]RVC47461.1 hypothetical protein EN781_01030 [Mesorhizobium sp. M4A.F.Ca.ET.090.04.2.1]TIW69332.1 MAG: hypothetical protein E5V60_01175 [Mesorhizobium sp.]
MSGTDKSKNHHWWPVGLQSYWTDKVGDVSWIEPSGKKGRKRAANRQIGFKIHGHTLFKGTSWEHRFEREFDIDNEIHDIVIALRKLKPLGYSLIDYVQLVKLKLKKATDWRDYCKYYDLDEKIHRDLLLLIYSLLIRSPANRSRFASYPEMLGLPPNEEIGKINMSQRYNIAKKLCKTGSTTNQYVVLLRSPIKKFIFGDGSLDWLTGGLVANRISGRALISLTPYLCVYLCTPMAMRSSPNCASLFAPPWMVDWVNEITQIYSQDKLFFLGEPPTLTEAFRAAKFLEHKKRTDALIEMLDKVAGIETRRRLFGFDAVRHV